MGLNLVGLVAIMSLVAMSSFLAIFVFGFVSLHAKETVKNDRPIIGVLAETTFGEAKILGDFYIAASYVKFIESGGGRVVPIFPNSTRDDIEKIFQYINGVLFPGGGVSLTKSGYAEQGKHFYELSLKAYDEGITFPVMGTCLGFELLNVVTSENTVHLSKLDSENYPIPLNLQKGIVGSRMFGHMPPDLLRSVKEDDITMNSHHWGVTPEDFENNKFLSSFYRILSLNKDRENKSFVSTMEGKKYPIFGLQWHPEKNLFEWTTKENIPHSPAAVHLTQYMAAFLVNQARLNDHKFPSPEEEAKAVIYNYNPIYTGRFSNFTQVYFF